MPTKVEIPGKTTFIVDAACGNGHSIALTSSREAFVWGNNKDGQLGFEPDSYSIIPSPKKLMLSEYMNSANREKFSKI